MKPHPQLGKRKGNARRGETVSKKLNSRERTNWSPGEIQGIKKGGGLAGRGNVKRRRKHGPRKEPTKKPSRLRTSC